jgi:hypothetical protein
MSQSSWTAVRVLVIMAMLGWRWVPRDWIPREMNQLRWALGCDEIENLERLLNRAETERMDQGYYNHLLDTGLDADLSPPICRTVDDLREVVLIPNLSIVRAKGTTWRTNERGMRDRHYALSKPAGTFRIAMTGDSIGVALGVSEGLGFEPALEQRLAEQSLERGGPVVEVLNFALPGRSPGQRWDHFQKVGWEMEPDVVLFEATAADIGWDHRRLAELLPRGIGWDSSLYGEILQRSAARPGATSTDYARALRPYHWDLVEAVYRAVAADCRARDVPCLWVLIPRVGRVVEPNEQQRLLDIARAAGFTAVVDISDTFDGFDPADLAIHPSDFHPNALGHALLARRLARALWPMSALRPLHGPSPTNVTGLDNLATSPLFWTKERGCFPMIR